MSKSEACPEIGGVYKLDFGRDREGIARVLCFDRVEVLYDAISADGRFYLPQCFGRKFNFFRIPYSLFVSKATFLQPSPLSEKEYEQIRPDLPLRLCRHQSLSWDDLATNQSLIGDLSEFEDTSNNGQIMVSEIYIIPRGKNGGNRKGVVVRSNESDSLRCQDLLRAVAAVQSSIFGSTLGVGLYRNGIERSMPSYYVGGGIDAAGNLIGDGSRPAW